MTLLTVVQNAMTQVGLTPPSVVYASTDEIVRQMKAFVMVEGRKLVDDHDWRQLLTASTFTCGAAVEQSAALPSDFLRMSNGVQMWNESNDFAIVGPVNADEYNDLIVRSVSSLPQYWRLFGSKLHIIHPVSGNTIRFEYITNKWILQAAVTAGTSLTADTDTFRVPENILELGVGWRFKKAKGLDYAEDMRNYELALAAAKMQDVGGRRIITTGREEMRARPRTWPGTITAV